MRSAPPRKASSVGSRRDGGVLQARGSPSFMSAVCEPGLAQQAPCGRPVGAADQQPARERADRAFHHADVLIGQEAGDASLPQHRLGEADQHCIVAAQYLAHGFGDRSRIAAQGPAERVAFLSRASGLDCPLSLPAIPGSTELQMGIAHLGRRRPIRRGAGSRREPASRCSTSSPRICRRSTASSSTRRCPTSS